MIAIVDYGMGNLRSVQKAFEAVGADARITSSPAAIRDSRSVVLPGVGAFPDCMKNLTQLDLVEPIRRAVQTGKPFLGLCLGLQLLFDESEEFGPVAGLGILPGKVARFPRESRDDLGAPLKIPHMGWNTVKVLKRAPLFESVPDESYFYFVHSYYVVPRDPSVASTLTPYGVEFVSGVQKDNIFAFQFHPEKSQKHGLELLKRFSRIN